VSPAALSIQLARCLLHSAPVPHLVRSACRAVHRAGLSSYIHSQRVPPRWFTRYGPTMRSSQSSMIWTCSIDLPKMVSSVICPQGMCSTIFLQFCEFRCLSDKSVRTGGRTVARYSAAYGKANVIELCVSTVKWFLDNVACGEPVFYPGIFWGKLPQTSKLPPPKNF